MSNTRKTWRELSAEKKKTKGFYDLVIRLGKKYPTLAWMLDLILMWHEPYREYQKERIKDELKNIVYEVLSGIVNDIRIIMPVGSPAVVVYLQSAEDAAKATELLRGFFQKEADEEEIYVRQAVSVTANKVMIFDRYVMAMYVNQEAVKEEKDAAIKLRESEQRFYSIAKKIWALHCPGTEPPEGLVCFVRGFLEGGDPLEIEVI